MTGLALYGQGTVNFANSAATAVTNGIAGGRVAAGTVFKVALYYLPGDLSAPTTADFDNGTIIATSGFFAAGLYNAGVQTAPTPAPGGGNGWFQVRAWETAFGATYAAAVANTTPQGGRLALVGTSNILRISALGNPNPPATAAAALTANGLQTFTVNPVPEPSVIGLGVLGIGALLLLRRRK